MDWSQYMPFGWGAPPQTDAFGIPLGQPSTVPQLHNPSPDVMNVPNDPAARALMLARQNGVDPVPLAMGFVGGTNPLVGHPESAGVWFHGTAGDHVSFDPAYIGSVTSNSEPGFWFTKSPEYASGYAQNAAGLRGTDPRIIEAELNLKNPLVVNFNEKMQPVVGGKVKSWDNNYDIIRHAQNMGHDGVIFPDGNFAEDSAAAVAFHNKDIRIHGPTVTQAMGGVVAPFGFALPQQGK